MNREEALFEQALGYESPAAREAYLREACAGDERLFQSVQALLRIHDRAGKFLDPDSRSPGTPSSLASAVGSASPSEKPGDRIGRYKLLEKIGEGGCGVVYMAEQEEPVRRRVALKVIRLGMDTEAVIARFEAERQALALMDHPNIAKVLDGGATETGRPYFVMELVRGTKITEFCDHNNLSTTQRLDLFMEVCRAIQHAHQKGVIHRDIKPSNILVTLHDGVPVPKIIDFGIAKATQGRLTDKTVFTAFHQFIGTPAYMSPEQAELSGLDIDTRSDVYSLGVLLYELLTGKTPFGSKELLEAGLDAMRRTIREQEPQRPSTKLSTMVKGELTSTASRRQTQAPKLVHAVSGDLDWIVMKCLEKDRARRYETANGLAADIQRHLRNEPVVASPPSKFYQFRKFVRRNRLLVSTGSAVWFCLLIALGSALWGFFEERDARHAVETLRAKDLAELHEAHLAAKLSQAKQLYQDHKRSEAERLLDEILPADVGPNSTHAALRRTLAWWYTINEEWNEAVTNLTILDRLDDPGDLYHVLLDCIKHGAVLVQQGDVAAYQKFRQQTLSRYLQTTNSFNAALVCRICLLLPAEEDAVLTNLDRLYKVIQHGQADPNMDPAIKDWGLFSMALVDYRRGDYQKAIADSKACLSAHVHSFRSQLRVPASQAVLAMSYHQVHQDAEARSSLTEARKDDLKNMARVSGDGDPWTEALFDGLYGRILTREASTLIEGSPGEDVRFYSTGEVLLGLGLCSGHLCDKSAAAAQAAKWFRAAMEHGSLDGKRNLASLLATCSDPGVRDGTNALRLAEEVDAAEGHKDPETSDCLASAYAATGHFDQAIQLEKEALARQPEDEAKKQIESHLKIFESGKPVRE